MTLLLLRYNGINLYKIIILQKQIMTLSDIPTCSNYMAVHLEIK